MCLLKVFPCGANAALSGGEPPHLVFVLGQPSAHVGTRGERRSSGVCEGVDEAVSDVRVGLELI